IWIYCRFCIGYCYRHWRKSFYNNRLLFYCYFCFSCVLVFRLINPTKKQALIFPVLMKVFTLVNEPRGGDALYKGFYIISVGQFLLGLLFILALNIRCN